MPLLKRMVVAVGIGFLLNLAWEFAHAPLYVHYQGGEISPLILARAAVVDALIILILLVFVRLLPPAHRQWVFIIAALVIAIVTERWALGTGRWAYTSAMPIVALLGTGLTPTIQLAATGAVAYFLSFRISKA